MSNGFSHGTIFGPNEPDPYSANSGSVLPANVYQRVVYKKPQRFIIYAHLGIDLEDRDPVPLCAASPITRWLHRRIGIAFNSKTRSLAAPRPRALPRRLCASTGARKATSEGQVERLGGQRREGGRGFASGMSAILPESHTHAERELSTGDRIVLGPFG